LFAEKTGVARRDNQIEIALLESCVRDSLNKTTARVMAVLDPVKVVITNYPEGETEELEAINNPEDDSMGSRQLPFSREIYIESNDFMEDPPRKYFRLKPEGYVRLKNAYIIQCDEVVKNEDGSIKELRCTYFPESRSGSDTSGIKVKGTIHWVSAVHALKPEIRLYDRLFAVENPLADEDKDFMEHLNPESLVITTAYVEPSLKGLEPGTRVQFMRNGYYCVDIDSTSEQLIFNKTVGLRDSWAKKNK
jgi:glutaminyl-tRNA synthetase